MNSINSFSLSLQKQNIIPKGLYWHHTQHCAQRAYTFSRF